MLSDCLLFVFLCSSFSFAFYFPYSCFCLQHIIRQSFNLCAFVFQKPFPQEVQLKMVSCPIAVKLEEEFSFKCSLQNFGCALYYSVCFPSCVCAFFFSYSLSSRSKLCCHANAILHSLAAALSLTSPFCL